MSGQTEAVKAFRSLVYVQLDPHNGSGTVLQAGSESGLSEFDRVRILGEELFRYMDRPIYPASRLARL